MPYERGTYGGTQISGDAIRSGNYRNRMKNAAGMQVVDMEKSQVELTAKEFEATAGGGAISVKVSGDKQIK